MSTRSLPHGPDPRVVTTFALLSLTVLVALWTELSSGHSVGPSWVVVLGMVPALLDHRGPERRKWSLGVDLLIVGAIVVPALAGPALLLALIRCGALCVRRSNPTSLDAPSLTAAAASTLVTLAFAATRNDWVACCFAAAAWLAVGSAGGATRDLAPRLALLLCGSIIRGGGAGIPPSAVVIIDALVVAGVLRDVSSATSRRALAWIGVLVSAGCLTASFTMGIRAPGPWLVYLALAILPAIAFWERGGQAPAVRGGPLVAAVLLALAFLVYGCQVAEAVCGVDFFYYACNARDAWLAEPSPPSSVRFIYFPGVYTFWGVAMRLLGTELASMQALYLGVLGVTGVLVGIVLRRAGAGPWLSLLGVAWTLRLLTRYEGLEGGTEPLCVIPILVGLAVWGGRPLQGQRGGALSAVLGASFGIAVYMKQQGVLLAAGAVVLIPLLFVGSPMTRPRSHAAAVVIGTASSVLLGGILLEGHGLEPLVQALWFMALYGRGVSHEGFVDVFTRESEYGLALVATSALGVAWWASILGTRWRRVAERPDMLIMGFAATAAVASEVQLFSRTFPHYQLLTIPFVVIACLLSLRSALELPGARRPVARWALVVAAALTLVRHGQHDVGFGLLPTLVGPDPRRVRPLDEDWSEDVTELRRRLRPGDGLVILPHSGSARTHFALGTRADYWDWGYTFFSERMPFSLGQVRWERVDAVLIFDTFVLPNEWEVLGSEDLVSELPGRGFAPSREGLRGCTLWTPQR